MFTIKTIGIGVMLGAAVSVLVVLVLGGQSASPSPTPPTTASVSPGPNETVTPQENDLLPADKMAKLAKAGIDVDTLVVLQECRNGWEAKPLRCRMHLTGQTSPNPK